MSPGVCRFVRLSEAVVGCMGLELGGWCSSVLARSLSSLSHPTPGPPPRGVVSLILHRPRLLLTVSLIYSEAMQFDILKFTICNLIREKLFQREYVN